MLNQGEWCHRHSPWNIEGYLIPSSQMSSNLLARKCRSLHPLHVACYRRSLHGRWDVDLNGFELFRCHVRMRLLVFFESLESSFPDLKTRISQLSCARCRRIGMSHFVCMALLHWIPQRTLRWIITSCVRRWLVLMLCRSERRNITRAATYITEMIIASNNLATDVTRQGVTIRTHHLIALRDRLTSVGLVSNG